MNDQPKMTFWHRLAGSPEIGRLIKNATNFVLSAVAILGLSQMLQRLSGSALWLPAEWRGAIEIISTLIGTSVFMYCYHRGAGAPVGGRAGQKAQGAQPVPPASTARPALTAEAGDVHAPATVALAENDGHTHHDDEEAHRRHHRHDLAIAISLTFVAMMLLAAYMLMRSRCLISWDAYDWWIHQEVHSKLPASPGAEALGADNAAPSEFVDIRRGKIFIPLWFPAEQKKYIDEIAAAKNSDGLLWIIQNEPDRLIDWERNPCRMQLALTSLLFAVIHILIICFVAAAAAYSFDPAESVVHLLTGGA